MNSLLKSIFIVLFPAFAVFAMIDSFWYVLNTGITLLHITHLLTAASIVFFFSRIYIKPIPRTDSVLKPYTFSIFLGCLLASLALSLEEGVVFRLSCTIFNIILTLGWIIYLVWYSYFQKRNPDHNDILKVGKTLPLLTFENSKKEIVTTERFAGTPSIFMFYRGNWCPFCMAQIKEIINQHEELTKRNINTIFISSQPHGFSKKLAKKYPLDFQFLVDINCNVAKQLNIFTEYGLPFGFQIFGFKSDMILPTVVITDSNEKIIYTNETDQYRSRPEPSILLKIIDENV
ncbi:redoxin domain-containing protein [Kordia antarctica]|nr:redoxin domain-containing protein [Kordia antarctica]